MSEQEKKNAIPVEGAVNNNDAENKEKTEKKESWFRRVIKNPKVIKTAKVIGRIAEGGLLLVIGYAAGKNAGPNMEALPESEHPKEETTDEEVA